VRETQARSKYVDLMAKCQGLAPVRTGNILAKQLTFLLGADAAGIVLGARVLIVLTSRADSVRARLASCAVGMLLAHARRPGAALGARGDA
jgi:phosphate acetyltransferase